MTATAFYSGSFDPVTHGHTDVIGRAARVFDRLVIGVGVHDAKSAMFSADERIEMLIEATGDIARAAACEIEVVTFTDLAVAAARHHSAIAIVRGLRDGTDLDYESQMAGMNQEMAPEIETIFFNASPRVRHIAANLVRQIAKMGGDVTPFVSPEVARRLAASIAA